MNTALQDKDQIEYNKSCAIIVTYNPDITPLLKLLRQLNKETNFVVIDNGSLGIEQLAGSITAYKKCQEIIQLENRETSHYHSQAGP